MSKELSWDEYVELAKKNLDEAVSSLDHYVENVVNQEDDGGEEMPKERDEDDMFSLVSRFRKIESSLLIFMDKAAANYSAGGKVQKNWTKQEKEQEMKQVRDEYAVIRANIANDIGELRKLAETEAIDRLDQRIRELKKIQKKCCTPRFKVESFDHQSMKMHISMENRYRMKLNISDDSFRHQLLMNDIIWWQKDSALMKSVVRSNGCMRTLNFTPGLNHALNCCSASMTESSSISNASNHTEDQHLSSVSGLSIDSSSAIPVSMVMFDVDSNSSSSMFCSSDDSRTLGSGNDNNEELAGELDASSDDHVILSKKRRRVQPPRQAAMNSSNGSNSGQPSGSASSFVNLAASLGGGTRTYSGGSEMMGGSHHGFLSPLRAQRMALRKDKFVSRLSELATTSGSSPTRRGRTLVHSGKIRTDDTSSKKRSLSVMKQETDIKKMSKDDGITLDNHKNNHDNHHPLLMQWDWMDPQSRPTTAELKAAVKKMPNLHQYSFGMSSRDIKTDLRAMELMSYSNDGTESKFRISAGPPGFLNDPNAGGFRKSRRERRKPRGYFNEQFESSDQISFDSGISQTVEFSRGMGSDNSRDNSPTEGILTGVGGGGSVAHYHHHHHHQNEELKEQNEVRIDGDVFNYGEIVKVIDWTHRDEPTQMRGRIVRIEKTFVEVVELNGSRSVKARYVMMRRGRITVHPAK